jgi:Iron-containing redox enzyme
MIDVAVTAPPYPADVTGDQTRWRPPLPTARGPLSDGIITALRSTPGHRLRVPHVGPRDLLTDDDAQLALTCCYELAYSGFAEVDDRWELDPGLLRVRAELEDAFVRSIVREIGEPRSASPTQVVDALCALADGDGPSLSGWVAEHATVDHLREFCIHRSQYQLKEADPHTWVIPRLRGRAKAAFVAIQFDEYGGGVASDMHAELFAETMRALGLDTRVGAYLDRIPAATLATGNLVTMFGLHRRWRAAAVGHLALFEMTSVGPMQRYSDALARLGIAAPARRFYDVHVTADEVHERIALDEMVADLVEQEPESAADVVFGARALALVETRFASDLLRAWRAGHHTLVVPGRTAASPSGDQGAGARSLLRERDSRQVGRTALSARRHTLR